MIWWKYWVVRIIIKWLNSVFFISFNNFRIRDNLSWNWSRWVLNYNLLSTLPSIRLKKKKILLQSGWKCPTLLFLLLNVCFVAQLVANETSRVQIPQPPLWLKNFQKKKRKDENTCRCERIILSYMLKIWKKKERKEIVLILVLFDFLIWAKLKHRPLNAITYIPLLKFSRMIT